METNVDYFSLQEKGQKPALYEAENRQRWQTELVPSGRIKNQDKRVVAISDRNHKNPKTAARNVANFLTDAVQAGGPPAAHEEDGFDMHYTPGSKKIGGLLNLHQARTASRDPSLNESALQLADTMERAKNIEGVRWISEFGGSGVLTQAMQILVDRGVKLHEHYVFLYRPTTSQTRALQLSQRLGLKIHRQFSKNMLLNPHEIAGGLQGTGGLATIYMRWRHEKGFTTTRALGNLARVGMDIRDARRIAAATGSAVAYSVGVAAGSAAVPAVATFVGAAAVAGVLAETYLPKPYHSIRSKFE